jgi:glyoxylate reductase
MSSYDRPLTPAELLDGAKGVDMLISLLTDKIDGEVMDAIGPQLKIISNYAVGFDNIDIKAATNRGIVVANAVSEESSEAVAEHTWALALALTRRIVEGDESVRQGAYRGWDPDLFLGTKIVGKTLGIIGLGRIGSKVAERARGYKMTVLYNKHDPDAQAEQNLGIKFVSLDELFAQSDFVSLHVPLTPETKGMINKESLAKFKIGSYLINTARGPIVQESALVEALRSGHLAGAALDVFENEPNVHAELLGMPNVITTPHIASATVEARNQMTEVAVAAVLDFLAGKKPQNIVDENVWLVRRK